MTKEQFENTQFKKGMKVKTKNFETAEIQEIDFSDCSIKLKTINPDAERWVFLQDIQSFIP